MGSNTYPNSAAAGSAAAPSVGMDAGHCPVSYRTVGAPPVKEEFRRIEKAYPLLASTGCTPAHCQASRMKHTDEPQVGLNMDARLMSKSREDEEQAKDPAVKKKEKAKAPAPKKEESPAKGLVPLNQSKKARNRRNKPKSKIRISEKTWRKWAKKMLEESAMTPNTKADAELENLLETQFESGYEQINLRWIEAHALDFIRQAYKVGKIYPSKKIMKARQREVIAEIRSDTASSPQGIWNQSFQELQFGVRQSWKHSRKCIMRSESSDLKLYDLRHVKDSYTMADALLTALCECFNNGDIHPSVFMFPPREPGCVGPQIFNDQILSFAGYQMPDGSILGDPANVGLTEAIIDLGWSPPETKTAYDLLPLVTMAEGDLPVITEIPETLFPLVEIRMFPGYRDPNPETEEYVHRRGMNDFNRLGMKWVPIPALSRLGYCIGGMEYTASPFAGWFMDSEVAVRDLGDPWRYNMLSRVANVLGHTAKGVDAINDNNNSIQLNLYLKAQCDLNIAVFWSFMQSGVRMTDTLTASAMFMRYDDEHLRRYGFRLASDMFWLMPPQGCISPLWHRGGAPNYQPYPLIARQWTHIIKIWAWFNGKMRKPKKDVSGVEEAQALEAGKASTTNDNDSDKQLVLASAAVPRSLTPSDEGIDMFPGRTARIFYCSAGTTAQRLGLRLEQRLRAWLCGDDRRSYGTVGGRRDSIVSVASQSSQGSTGSQQMELHHSEHTSSDFRVLPPAVLNSFDPADLQRGDLVLVIASNAGRGDVPTNGQALLQLASTIKEDAAKKEEKEREKEKEETEKTDKKKKGKGKGKSGKGKKQAKEAKEEDDVEEIKPSLLDPAVARCVSFAVFGNGNTTYGGNFNGGAIQVQAALRDCGLTEGLPMEKGDTAREDPPWQQFGSWLGTIHDTLVGHSTAAKDKKKLGAKEKAKSHVPTRDEEIASLDLQIPALNAVAAYMHDAPADNASTGDDHADDTALGGSLGDPLTGVISPHATGSPGSPSLGFDASSSGSGSGDSTPSMELTAPSAFTGIRCVTFDVEKAISADHPYNHMSHIDMYVPMSDAETDAVLQAMHLTGNETVSLGGKRTATVRQLASLVDLSQPLSSLGWVRQIGRTKLGLTPAEADKLLETSVGNLLGILSSDSISDNQTIRLPPSWYTHIIGDDASSPHSLLRFMATLPYRRPRTYSTASSPTASDRADGLSPAHTMDLMVQTRPGGQFSDNFLGRAMHGTPIYARLRRGPGEYLARSTTKPLIAFVIGSGMAPLRGLLQARVALAKQYGEGADTDDKGNKADEETKDAEEGKANSKNANTKDNKEHDKDDNSTDNKDTTNNNTEDTQPKPITIFAGFRPVDADTVMSAVHDAMSLGLIDDLVLTPSNPAKIRAQNRVFDKLQDEHKDEGNEDEDDNDEDDNAEDKYDEDSDEDNNNEDDYDEDDDDEDDNDEDEMGEDESDHDDLDNNGNNTETEFGPDPTIGADSGGPAPTEAGISSQAALQIKLAALPRPGPKYRSQVLRRKILFEGANVFVCASKSAADEFAANLSGVVGVRDIREALGERWVEEVYVAGG